MASQRRRARRRVRGQLSDFRADLFATRAAGRPAAERDGRRRRGAASPPPPRSLPPHSRSHRTAATTRSSPAAACVCVRACVRACVFFLLPSQPGPPILAFHPGMALANLSTRTGLVRVSRARKGGVLAFCDGCVMEDATGVGLTEIRDRLW